MTADRAFANIEGMPPCPVCAAAPMQATIRFGGLIRDQLVLPSASLSCGHYLDADWTVEFYNAIPLHYRAGWSS